MTRKLLVGFLLLVACMLAEDAARGVELQLPKEVVAGADMAVPTMGSGSATFYLVGPAGTVKRAIKLGQEIQIKGEDVRAAGRYVAVITGDNGGSGGFWVMPAKVANVGFIAQPSRLPVALPGAVSGVVYAFDHFHNLVYQPQPVKFELSVAGAPTTTRTVATKDGVAWTRMDSGRKQGAAQFDAEVDGISARRVVQQVAGDPCNLRMKAQRTPMGILVETDPIRDCSGNPVPDGTIVTFTSVDSKGTTTVDARIKRDVASAQLPAADRATISVASGVVLGNEIRIGGAQ